MRAQRAKLKSCKDDDISARGKRGTSAAPGYESKMISCCGVAFTRGGGLGGLALGYYQAAPPGLRRGEPTACTGRRNDIQFTFYLLLVRRQ